MRLFVFAGLLLHLMIGSAAAADLPLKAPPLRPVVTWAGFYGGFNAGYSYGNDPYRSGIPGLESFTTTLAAPSGGLFGGQIGYNWQFGKVVFGLEGDGQWAGQRGTGCGGPECALNSVPESGAFLTTDRIDWFATARARLGWANERYLLYVTGGAASAGIRRTDAANIDFVDASLDHRATLTGSAIGVGAEVAVWDNWSVKIEYLHLDFGRLTTRSFLTGAGPGVAFANDVTTVGSVRDNIIRVGLNYHPGGVPASVPAGRAPMTYSDWSGLYAGVNVGYGVANDPFVQSDLTPGALVAAIGSFAPSRVGPKGGFLGGQLGYNAQFKNIVLGVEGDGQWADQRDTQCSFSCDEFFRLTKAQKLSWFATARGRIGWAEPSYLVYVTGGGAWAAVNEVDTFFLVGTQDISAAFNQVKGGWTAGGGIEVRLWEKWSAKLEYLHLDLGVTNHSFTITPVETVTSSSSIRNDIVRLGLNYRVGG